MGSSKTTNTSNTNTTSTPTPPAYVDEYNKAQVGAAQRQLPQQEALQNTAMQTQQNVYNAFANNTPLTGYLGTLQGITPEQTNSMVGEALRYADPSAQGMGVLNSGAYGAIRARTAAQVMNSNAQFNVGALQNLLNLANTGQAQVQQPMNQQQAITSSRLAGLNSTNSYGNSTQTQLGQNPFVNSFETSLGNTFGTGMGNFGMGAIPKFH